MTVTPSPQSVVSDRALEQIAFNLCSLHDFPVDFVKANERFARSVITEYLRAAPAPSSLAGGEAMKSLRFIANMERNTDRLGSVMVANWIIQDLAALSPEAPAREGEDATLVELRSAGLRSAGWSVAVHNDYRLNGEQNTFWLWTHPSGRWIKGEGKTDADALQQCVDALTPRHEAPASEGDAS